MDRRERRMAKIKAGGASRLEKITGRPEQSSVKDQPSPEATDRATASPAPSATHSVRSIDSSQELQEKAASEDADPPMSVPGGSLENSTVDYESDPLFQMLKQLQGNNSAQQGGAQDPMSILSNIFGQEVPPGPDGPTPMPGSTPGTQSPPPQASALKPKEVIWQFINLLGVVMVIVYSFRGYSPVLTFSTVELLLHTTRFVVEKGSPPDSTIVSLAMYLPDPFKSYLITGARYLRFFRVILQDFLMLVFLVAMTNRGAIAIEPL
uniref:ARAD1C00946p n=1 Tax=Blastobotrys adeninivorans TaxID=409370 RepID=A0A060SZI4_BLAAD